MPLEPATIDARTLEPTSASAPSAAPALEEPSDDEAYRLVSIATTRAPAGCVGRDWFSYRISQGSNWITGYRQGDLQTVTDEVDKIVIALNERRQGTMGRRRPKPGRPPAAAARAQAAEPEDVE
jgi:hypothetical protein